MPRGRRTKKRLWRWRRNPLRRRDDVIEAWTVLAVWTVVTVGGTATGLVTAHAADDVFARQRAERHSVGAVVVSGVPPTAAAIGGASGRRMATVRWTGPDGSARTGRTLVETGLDAGTRVTVWQDAEGRLTSAPPDTTEAAIEAGVLGTGAAAALAGLVFGGGAVVRWRLDRRRADEGGREWELVGPRWGHQTS